MEITIEDIKKMIGEVIAELLYENMVLRKKIATLEAEWKQSNEQMTEPKKSS